MSTATHKLTQEEWKVISRQCSEAAQDAFKELATHPVYMPGISKFYEHIMIALDIAAKKTGMSPFADTQCVIYALEIHLAAAKVALAELEKRGVK